MQLPKPGSSASLFLNATRGVAAIVVALGHAKLMLLKDARDFPNLSAIQKIFYLLSSFGNNAVLVFFVLSGFLVGGSALQSLREHRWSWTTYIVTRVSRLYTVLIPALVTGGVIDLTGSAMSGNTSPYSVPFYGTMLPQSIRDSVDLRIFLGNLSFLQEILVPTMGSNRPLWSLTNEGWYYVLFPLIAVAIFLNQSFFSRCALLALAAAISRDATIVGRDV